MRHRNARKSLVCDFDHHKALVANLVKGIFKAGGIQTTQARGKEASKLAERLISIAKGGGVASRRSVFEIIQDRTLTKRIFTSIVSDFGARQGGYTRILKLGKRRGDNAQMVRVELVKNTQ